VANQLAEPARNFSRALRVIVLLFPHGRTHSRRLQQEPTMKRLLSLLTLCLGLAFSFAAVADGQGCSEKAKAEKNKTSTLVEPAPEMR
jgi:hypothetical protein